MTSELPTRKCVLCESTFFSNHPGDEEDDNINDMELLKNLCNSLSIPFYEVKLNFIEVIVCQECSPLLYSALVAKENFECVEKSVRDLQMKLLKEMRCLQGAIQSFYETLRTIDVQIEDARSAVKCSSKEANAFRRTIKQVMQEMSTCGETLDKKIITNSHISVKENTPRLETDTDNSDVVKGTGAAIRKSTKFKKVIRRKRKEWPKSKVRVLSSDSDIDNGQEDQKPLEQNDNEDNDEWKPEENCPPEKSNSSTSSSSEDLLDPNIDYSVMSNFKKYIVSRVLRRKMHILKNEVTYSSKRITKYNIENPRSRYFIDYNARTDTLFLEDVIINLDDTDKNNEYIECSKCSYRLTSTKKKRKVPEDLKMIDHILGHHLKVFMCDRDGKTFTSRVSYMEHMREHLSSTIHICDICGKPLKSKEQLGKHKWLHMNQEEKEIALKSGRKNYPYKMKPEEEGKTHQCSICGVSFRFAGDLKSHQDTHLDRNQRTVTCPNCGKAILKQTFRTSHSKICRPKGEELPPVKCTKCPKILKNVMWMKVHLRKMHSEKSEERPYICGECGKGFKRMFALNEHMKSHSSETPFECGKGCGKCFKRKHARTRHEIICGGGGKWKKQVVP